MRRRLFEVPGRFLRRGGCVLLWCATLGFYCLFVILLFLLADIKDFFFCLFFIFVIFFLLLFCIKDIFIYYLCVEAVFLLMERFLVENEWGWHEVGGVVGFFLFVLVFVAIFFFFWLIAHLWSVIFMLWLLVARIFGIKWIF